MLDFSTDGGREGTPAHGIVVILSSLKAERMAGCSEPSRTVSLPDARLLDGNQRDDWLVRTGSAYG